MASQTWVDEEGARDQSWITREGVKVQAWVDESSVSLGRTTRAQEREGPPEAITHVWLAAPGVHNLDHIILYHRREVSP